MCVRVILRVGLGQANSLYVCMRVYARVLQELGVASLWSAGDVEPQLKRLQFKQRTVIELVAENWRSGNCLWCVSRACCL